MFGGWGRPRRNLPEVDYNESSDEDEFRSPAPPQVTRAGSPVDLVIPTLCDNVDEDLEAAVEKLNATPLYRGDRSKLPEIGEPEVIVQGHIKGAPESDKSNKEGNMPNNNAAAAAVDFDIEDADDGEKAQDLARSIKLEFEPNNIRFWFSQLEAEMLMATVKSQWLKKTILQRNLPNKQKEDVMDYLTLQKTEAGDDIYHRIKQELTRLYAPKPQDSYKKALARTMTGLPSQLGAQIVNDICKKPNKLQGCCCAAAALAIWDMKLPVQIRAHISNMDFSPATYKSVFEAADQVYLSSSQVTVAAVTTTSQLDETLPAFSTQNQPSQVAAVQRGNRGNRGGRNRPTPASSGTGGGGRNRNQSNQNQPNQGQGQAGARGQSRGPRHSSNPPDSCCSRHYRHGADAWYCLAPLTCPWVNKCSSRPTST